MQRAPSDKTAGPGAPSTHQRAHLQLGDEAAAAAASPPYSMILLQQPLSLSIWTVVASISASMYPSVAKNPSRGWFCREPYSRRVQTEGAE